jgi:glycosyltransferase involved in cell wall biosynthesis
MDGRMLGVQSTGVATYAQGLSRALPLISSRCAILEGPAHDDTALRRLAAALLTGTRSVRTQAGREGSPFTRFLARDIYRRAHVHFSIYGRLLRIRPPAPAGIMHWTYPVPIVAQGWTNIYTVHDLIPLRHPSLSQVSPARLKAVLRQIATAAARIVTVSAAARQELTGSELLGEVEIVDAGQLVAPGTPSPGLLPSGLVPGNYLLFCGSHEPRKNLSLLLQAYAASCVAMPLVLTGPDGWNAHPDQDAIARTPNVMCLPYLERDSLLAVMASARALIAPSLAEGFGLPLAEAMALGVPTVASDIPSHREIAQGASLLVDPHCIKDIAAAIGQVARDDTLAARLAAEGRTSAARFGLEGFAHRLSGIYEAAFAERPVST